jgi:predicted Zn-dependent peptidase
MKHHLTTLPNNLRVVTAEMPQAYSATVSVAVGVGSRHESFAKNGGVSHFLEHLLFKGTKLRPSTKIISEQIDAVGGWNNAYTSNEQTNFIIKLPYQHVELGVDILADMLQNSLFDADEIDRERGVVIEEMNVYRDDPASYVHRLTPELLWPGHPLSRDVIGSEKVIGSVQRDAIMAYQQSFYRPGNMVLAVAGRIKHEDVVAMAERFFGTMEDAPVTPIRRVTKGLADKKTNAITKDTAQTHLVIGTTSFADRHPDEVTTRIISTILGRGLSSRLFLNVRERKGLAYAVGASQESFVDTGALEVYAGVNVAKTNDAIGAILEELQLIAKEPVGEAELAKAKHQMQGSLQMSMESNSAVADRLSSELAILGKIQSVEEIIAEIEAVTVRDVQRVAQQLFGLDRLRLGIISPEADSATKHFEQLISS